jgi:putative holliday junction resolvase
MSRLLGIDYGKKRIGLAISDPLGIFASGLDTLENRSPKQVVQAIQSIIQAYNVEKLIVGLPLKTSGEAGVAVEGVQQFGTWLSEATGLPIFYQDERFTSFLAEKSLREQNIKPSRQKHLVDKVSAALILQQYLDKLSR